MDLERVRSYLLSLPHVLETVQFSDNLVYWVGDKAIGGKMFCMIDVEGNPRHALISFAAGPEHYAELLEREGLSPAPYLARAYWVAVESWQTLRDAEWREELSAAHALTLGKMTPRTRAKFELPERERKKLIAERKKLLAERAKVKG